MKRRTFLKAIAVLPITLFTDRMATATSKPQVKCLTVSKTGYINIIINWLKLDKIYTTFEIIHTDSDYLGPCLIFEPPMSTVKAIDYACSLFPKKGIDIISNFDSEYNLIERDLLVNNGPEPNNLHSLTCTYKDHYGPMIIQILDIADKREYIGIMNNTNILKVDFA